MRSASCGLLGICLTALIAGTIFHSYHSRTGDLTPELVVGRCGWAVAVAYSPDGSMLASGEGVCGWTRSGAGRIALWDARTGALIRAIVHGDSVNCVAFSPDGGFLASGADSKNGIIVVESRSGELVTSMRTPHLIHQVTFSPDGKLLASATDHSGVWLWAIPSGTLLWKRQDMARSGSLVFSPDGSIIASGSHDRGVILIDALTGREVNRLQSDKEGATSVCFSPHGDLIAAGDQDGIIRLWRWNESRLAAVLPRNGEPIRSLSFSRNGRTLASALRLDLILWDVTTQSIVRKIDSRDSFGCYEPYLREISFSPDGGRLAAACWDKTIRIWSTRTGDPKAVMLTLNPKIKAIPIPDWLVITPDGYHDGSPPGRRAVRFRDGEGRLVSDSIRNGLWRPDLVRAAMTD